MDILQPRIVTVGNRRYRKNPFTLSFQESKSNAPLKPYEEETDDMFLENRNRNEAEYEDESCMQDENQTCKVNPKKSDYYEDKDGDNIQQDKDGSFHCSMSVPDVYIGKIHNKKRVFEENTNSSLHIPPRSANKDGLAHIKIQSKNKSNVASCRNQILLTLSEARLKSPFTHILTFPFKFEPFKKKLEEFKREIMKTCNADRGICESIFQNPHRLHLTICTLVLANKSEVDQIQNLLDKCRQTFIKDILDAKPLKVSVKGLEYMNDDPEAVDVLYATVLPVAENTRDSIQQISDKLMETLLASGFAKKQFDRVKLHLTVINSLRRQENDESSQTKVKSMEGDKGRESFDARRILKLFKDFDFGVYTLNEIELSVRYSVSSGGYFECAAKINL